MMQKYILFLILGVDALTLFFQASQLSISYYEANILYGNFSFLQFITNLSLTVFGQNDFALRLPMMILHFLSVILLYLISSKYLKHKKDRLWLVLIFILLPGSISSALQINSAGLLIFGLFLFVYIYQHFKLQYTYALLLLYAFIDGGFLYLFLALILFAYYVKNKIYFMLNSALIFISLFLYDIDVHGLPSGHLVDTLGVYFAIFSPIVFVYLFYVLYKKLYTKEIDITWFISFIPLAFSLILSLRQRVGLDQFAPYVMVALPSVAQIFVNAYRVRLKIFRKKYKVIFIISILFLFFNSLVVLFNKELYLVIQNPKKHFAYKMYVVKELATKLKKMNIHCIKSNNDLSKRLKFYKIDRCIENVLLENRFNGSKISNVTISYKDNLLYQATVTNLNNI